MATWYLRHREVMHLLRTRETLLGRSDQCGLVLPYAKVSRLHAVIRVDDEGATVVDLGSLNGTRVNGHRLRGPRRLLHGDVVQIGAEELEVVRHAGSSVELGATSPPSTEPGHDQGSPDATVDLVSSLLESSTLGAHGDAAIDTLRALLDNLITRLAAGREPHDARLRARIEQAADAVSRRFPEEELLHWRARVRERLNQLGEGS